MMHKLSKLNSKGFGHVVAVIAIAVVAVVVGAGVVVYRHQHKAHAAVDYQYIAGGYSYSIYGCVNILNIYGGVANVNIQFRKAANISNLGYTLQVTGGGVSTSFQAGSSYYNNVVALLSTNASIALHQNVYIAMSGLRGANLRTVSWSGQPIYLPRCSVNA